jgi:ribosome-binding protein aMBF1 (putative translation factor)
MFCEKCGKEATQNAKFCQYCGSELTSADKSERNEIESLSPFQFDKKKKNQLIEPQKKDESKRFLGGVYHPWRRFFARTVDLISIGIPIFFAIFVFN